MIRLEYDRQGESQKFTVKIVRKCSARYFYNVSLYSVDRLHKWLDAQYPHVYGGGNYYGSYYTVKI